MKSILKTIATTCFILLLIPAISKAQLKLPQASPKAQVTQTFGLTDITVDYHSPSVKARKIWGDVVPFDSVWRTGANEATVISFSDDVVIEGKKLAAGKYAFFTIPGKTEWTLIFNKKKDLWGAYGYNKEEDVLRVNVKPMPNTPTESMAFTITDITINTCTVNIVWENLRVPFRVAVETDKKVMAIINDSLSAKPTKAVLFRQAAGYTITSGLHLEKGLDWINTAIAIKEEFRSYWTKAQILAKMNKYNEALAAANKALDLGKGDKDFNDMKPGVDKAIATYKTKIGK